jgi:hypothetical protein
MGKIYFKSDTKFISSDKFKRSLYKFMWENFLIRFRAFCSRLFKTASNRCRWSEPLGKVWIISIIQLLPFFQNIGCRELLQLKFSIGVAPAVSLLLFTPRRLTPTPRQGIVRRLSAHLSPIFVVGSCRALGEWDPGQVCVLLQVGLSHHRDIVVGTSAGTRRCISGGVSVIFIRQRPVGVVAPT